MIGQARFGVALGFGVACGLGIAGLAGISGRTVERAFAEAISARGHEGGGFELARTAGSEAGLWLSRADHDVISPFSGPIAIGDRITVRGTHERVLEVVDVKPLSAPVTKTSDATGVVLLMVTCTVAGATDGKTVRFIVEGESAETADKAKSL
jgi:hypothetical protein